MSIYSQTNSQAILPQSSGTITTNSGTITTNSGTITTNSGISSGPFIINTGSSGISSGTSWVNLTYAFKQNINLSNIYVFKTFIDNLDNNIKKDYDFNLLIPSDGSKWTIIMESKFNPKIKVSKLCDYLCEAFTEFIREDYIGDFLLVIKFFYNDTLLENKNYNIVL